MRDDIFKIVENVEMDYVLQKCVLDGRRGDEKCDKGNGWNQQ